MTRAATHRWLRSEAASSAIALIVFSVVFIAESVISYRQTSATWDEPVHAASGYYALAKGDFRYAPIHPPLARMLAALPLLAEPRIAADTTAIDNTRPDLWPTSGVFNDAHRFLYTNQDADRLLYAARFVVVSLGVALGVALFLWTRAWLGFVPAVAALAMMALEPNLVANFSLVTTDAAVTCFSFAAVYFLWRAVARASLGNITAVCIACALAVTSKFSGVLLFPVLFAILILATYPMRRLSALRALAIAAGVLATSFVAVWAAYRFRFEPSTSLTWLYRFQDHPDVIARVPILTRLVAWSDAHRLLPNAYAQGFLLSQAQAQVRTAFLAGDYSTTGWWYFFPIAIAIKTPLALLLLALVGLVVGLRAARREQRSTVRLWFVLLPIAGFLAPAMATHLNIGIRHVLPIFPFFIMLAALAIRWLLDRKDTLGRAAIALAAILWAIEYGRAYPHTLAFFNSLVGGPAHGIDYLVDSNLDWGQDLKGLKQWMDDNRVGNISLSYFGSADPAYYNIDCTYLNGSPTFVPRDALRPPRLPGYVAVSATNLTGAYFDAEQRDFYKPLLARTPVASIGHSIFVYWVDQPWWPQRRPAGP